MRGRIKKVHRRWTGGPILEAAQNPVLSPRLALRAGRITREAPCRRRIFCKNLPDAGGASVPKCSRKFPFLKKSSQQEPASLNEKHARRHFREFLAAGAGFHFRCEKRLGVDRRTGFQLAPTPRFEPSCARRHRELWGDSTGRLRMLVDIRRCEVFALSWRIATTARAFAPPPQCLSWSNWDRKSRNENRRVQKFTRSRSPIRRCGVRMGSTRRMRLRTIVELDQRRQNRRDQRDVWGMRKVKQLEALRGRRSSGADPYQLTGALIEMIHARILPLPVLRERAEARRVRAVCTP